MDATVLHGVDAAAHARDGSNPFCLDDLLDPVRDEFVVNRSHSGTVPAVGHLRVMRLPE